MRNLGRTLLFAALGASLPLAGVARAATPSGVAPGSSSAGSWSHGSKDLFGAAYESYDEDLKYSARSDTAPISNVWFTGASGILTEVFWPTNDTPQTRDSQLLVTAADRGLFEERRDARRSVRWIERGVPAFRVITEDPGGRFRIEKIIFADPDRDVVLQRLRITRKVRGLRFFVLHNPSAGNTPLGDSAMASTGGAPGAGLFAWQGPFAQALVTSIRWRDATAGFSGTESDGYRDLQNHRTLTTHYRDARDGDVVLTGELDLPLSPGVCELTLALGFGRDIDEAHRAAQASLGEDPDALLDRYRAQWRAYQASLRPLGSASPDLARLYRSSVAVMKSLEDRAHPGAFIASPSVPWGDVRLDRASAISPRTSSTITGGYHLVWPRDLSQIALALLAAGDTRSPVAAMRFMKGIQLSASDGTWDFGSLHVSKEGSFYQNTWSDGEPYWRGLELDQVAQPIDVCYHVVEARLVAAGACWDLARRAADFLVAFGPWTPLDRWEEVSGVSPSTLAFVCTALVHAAELAGAMGDPEREARYRETAERWARQIDGWTFTTQGGTANGRYFVRVDGTGSPDAPRDPNDERRYVLRGRSWLERDIVDCGFLRLVVLGVRPALAANIADSRAACDAALRVEVPGVGPGFFRYVGDGYGFDPLSGERTGGMLWPILSGERAEYELAKALEKPSSPAAARKGMRPYLDAMGRFATASQMLPEQVFDRGPRAGQPTGSAAPLGWAHAELVLALRAHDDAALFRRPMSSAGGAARGDATPRGTGAAPPLRD
ncbi:glycoside hydrolase family 15 protein [Sorangium sp. So ce124]|uniref:glycoside hydrolase family 15 protein n=1 Tax=Sorangium sp. So ce124 TaxID=3133280 RepID=UPI003F6137A0